MIALDIETPRWAVPLLPPMRYKGAKGGRSSGKSHFFAEGMVEALVIDKDKSAVCIREIQKSLKFSAKRLIESKIRKLKVSHLFHVTNTEIKRVGGEGVIIFQGMQDHTADSIKSLEGFDIAWVEEAQSISKRSLDLLLPTIRAPGSEIWFSWNPDQEDDPIDTMFSDPEYMDACVCVHVNYIDNPFCPDLIIEEAMRCKRSDPDAYAHIWLGGYNTKSDDQIFCGKWEVDEFEPEAHWDGPYFGADWGFSTDPNTLMGVYIANNILYIRHEAYRHRVEIVDTPDFFRTVEAANDRTIRADNARPEIISHMQRNGYPRVVPVEKWKGSVEDGISTIRGYDKVVIHTECEHIQEEARLYKYKRDRLTGDILPDIIDKHNHCWDAVRYAISPFVKRNNLDTLLAMAANQ